MRKIKKVMNINSKILQMTGAEPDEQKMYRMLMSEQYRTPPYEMCDLEDKMALVEQNIHGWMKPRFLLDHRAQTAYEFMDKGFVLVTVRDEDVHWDSLKGLPEQIIARARRHDGYFPTVVYGFRNGKADVQWQINPDGGFYMDNYGFGMTDDLVIPLWGKIDRTGCVVEPFRYLPMKR